MKVAPDPRTAIAVLRCTELIGGEALGGHPRSLLLSPTSLVLYDVQEDIALRCDFAACCDFAVIVYRVL